MEKRLFHGRIKMTENAFYRPPQISSQRLLDGGNDRE